MRRDIFVEFVRSKVVFRLNKISSMLYSWNPNVEGVSQLSKRPTRASSSSPDLLIAKAHIAVTHAKEQKGMTRVGFEPTPPKRPDP